MFRNVVLAATAAAVTMPARAAEIVVGSGTIIISGDIVASDFDQFKTKASPLSGKQIVVLISDGGSVLSALQIGEFIRLRGWETAVPSYCYSACALIWLAGSTRTMNSTAKIGLHAASVGGKEAGMGNALVGTYLNRLSHGYDVVAFATVAGPDKNNLMTPKIAERLGVEVSVIETAAKPAQVQPPITTAPAGVKYVTRHLTQTASVEEGAALFIRSIIDQYNLTSAVSPSIYAGAVAYYGKALSKAAVLEDKKQFGDRWTYRYYSPSDMTIACQDEHTCAVHESLDWEAANIKKHIIAPRPSPIPSRSTTGLSSPPRPAASPRAGKSLWTKTRRASRRPSAARSSTSSGAVAL